VLFTAIVAVGCSSTSGGKGGSGSATSSSVASATVDTVNGAHLVDGVPPRPPCQGPSGGAPAKGVTADTVQLGVLYPDTKSLASIGFGVDNGPFDAAYKALLEAPNTQGGICGRKVAADVVLYNPLVAGDDSKGCTKLTEDKPHFIVFAGGGATTASLQCLAGQGNTLTLTETPQAQGTADQLGGRLFSLAENWDTYFATVPKVLQQAGLLKGKVGFVYGASGESDVYRRAIESKLLPGLKDLGLDPVTCVLPASASQPEGAAAIPLCVEKFESSGVSTLLAAIDIYSLASFANEAAKQGLHAHYVNVGDWVSSAVASLLFEKVSKPQYFDGMVTTTGLETDAPPPPSYRDDCLRRIEQAGVKPAPADMTEFQREFMVSVCFRVDVMLYAVAAAGPAPTQASFIAALEKTPAFRAPTGVAGSWAPHKHFFVDETYLREYDAAARTTKPYTNRGYALG
jgi:hypothetical protein